MDGPRSFIIFSGWRARRRVSSLVEHFNRLFVKKQLKHSEWCFGLPERRISTDSLVLSDDKVQWMDGLHHHHGVNE